MNKFLSVFVFSALLAVHPLLGRANPEETVKRFKAAIEQGQAVELLDLLPPSYVTDATGLVQDFGRRMDPELWAKLRDTIAKATTVLAPKAELFVGMADEAVVPEAVKAARATALREAIAAFGTLAKSSALDLERLKTVEAMAFAQEVGTAFAAATAASKALESTETKTADPFKVLKSETLPSGHVALTFADEDGGEGQTQELKQVEGRWVPADMADEWAESIADARASLQKLDFTTPEGQQQKAQLMMVMQMLDPMIQQFAQAESAEQLQQMMGGMLMPLMMMGGGMGGGMQ